MFPFRDHNPSNRTPYVTWALIIANIGIFLSYYPALSSSPAQLFGFYDVWALIPTEILSGGAQETLISHMFLHGGWLHLIFNMLFLWVFGDNLEDLLGHIGFLLFYLASGLGAAAAQIIAGPDSSIPMVGASGAIAGVMGGYLVLFPKARVDVLVILVIILKVFTVPAWLMLGFWFVLQLVNGLVVDGANGGVAYWAHAGGFIVGALLILPAFLKRGGPGFWRTTHGRPPHAEVVYVRQNRGRYALPKVRRVETGRSSDQPVADLSRIPKAGTRRVPRSPWGGGRD